MKILVDARPLIDASSGGVRRVGIGLIQALIKNNPDWEFVLATTGRKKKDLPFLLPKNARHEHLPYPNKLISLFCLSGLVSFDQLFSKERIDRLFLCNLGFFGRPKVPYLLLVHDISFLIEPKWFSKKARLWHKAVRAKKSISGAQHLFAVSERTRQDLMEYCAIPPSHITHIELGTSVLSELTKKQVEGRYVLALGGNDLRKNAGCAIEAVNALRSLSEFQDVRLVLIGGNPVFDMQDKQEGRVIYLRPSDAELASLYKYASAFLYPSWYEGFGLPLHEAAQFGTPCIAATAGALPETAPKGTLFALPSKPQFWQSALEMILKSPNEFFTQTQQKSWDASAQTIQKTLVEHT